MYEGDPRNVLAAWLSERSEMAHNSLHYNQPLVLTEKQVRALLDLRICRASFEMDSGQVVHCLEPEGHLYMHRAGFSWSACPMKIDRYGETKRCILPDNHKGAHDFGGWGINYSWPEKAVVTSG